MPLKPSQEEAAEGDRLTAYRKPLVLVRNWPRHVCERPQPSIACPDKLEP
jgi:hypothetical protein